MAKVNTNILNHAASFLKVNISASYYQDNVLQRWKGHYMEMVPYWDIIPSYIVSRCPICNHAITQQVDTYNLYTWSIRHNPYSVKYSEETPKPCSHFVALHTFLNLCGRKPTKAEMVDGAVTSSEPEVPYLSPRLLPNDLKSYAVLHTLPICRILKDKFVPSYLLFVVGYFSENGREIENRRLCDWTGDSGWDVLLNRSSVPWAGGMRLPEYWEEVEDCQLAWSLETWNQNKRLFWLNESLEFATEQDQYPFASIKGLKHGYAYKNREYQTFFTKRTVLQFQEGLAVEIKYGGLKK